MQLRSLIQASLSQTVHEQGAASPPPPLNANPRIRTSEEVGAFLGALQKCWVFNTVLFIDLVIILFYICASEEVGACFRCLVLTLVPAVVSVARLHMLGRLDAGVLVCARAPWAQFLRCCTNRCVLASKLSAV